MPLYGTPQAGGVITTLVPGGPLFYLLNNEMLAAGQSSIAFAYTVPPLYNFSPAFFVQWAVVPTAFNLSVQASSTTDTNAAYSAAGGSITSSPGFLWSATLYPVRKFYRVNMFSITGGSGLTVIVRP